ncbi:MAG: helix-turn-helix domain-containing protein [Parvularculaceae bacterium]|nr:helix-turn-helix domain-containing protein [Parvularculaceae bacterium]
MNLATYIKQNGLRRSAFADKIGVSPTIVTQWCAGDAWPSADMARRIFDATDGQVTPNDFLADRRNQPKPAEAA